MTTSSGARPLTLTASNFGPIANASIELRPMTVFVGPSNTGKSYAAVLLYVLHHFFHGYGGTDRIMPDIGSPWNLTRSAANQWVSAIDRDRPTLTADAIETILSWMVHDPSTGMGEDLSGNVLYLPNAMAGLVRGRLKRSVAENDFLGSELRRCFGVDHLDRLARHHGDGATVIALHGATSDDTLSRTFGFNGTLDQGKLVADTDIPESLPLSVDRVSNRYHFGQVDRRLLPELDDADKSFLANNALGDASRQVLSRLVEPMSRRAHYLPADRSGVMHAHQVVVRALIVSASRGALRSDSLMPTLSGVLGDFLEQLIDLARWPANRDYPQGLRAVSPPNDLAHALERDILRGSVDIEQTDIDYPSLVYRPDNGMRDVPLMNASSMVSELTPVVLYLRHVVQRGDVLIVEEPESHLHPAAQVEFTRLLARAIHAGIRIVITTHSEWVLEELANLVRLSELPRERRAGIAGSEVALRPDQVGAWFFEPRADQGGFGGEGIGFGCWRRDVPNRLRIGDRRAL